MVHGKLVAVVYKVLFVALSGVQVVTVEISAQCKDTHSRDHAKTAKRVLARERSAKLREEAKVRG